MDSLSIVILGNGFDVAQGIPTRYSQFYQKCKGLHSLADKGNALCKHIIDNINSELWSDLECGLYHYSLGITREYGADCLEQAEKFQNEFNELRKALFDYLNSVSGTQVDINFEAAVIGLNIEWRKLEPQFLTFNYSINTAATANGADRYIYNNDDSLNELRFIYQHGSIYDPHVCRNRKPDEIVVGIDPNTQPVEHLHSFLYKTNQRLHEIGSTMDYISKKRFYVVYGCSVGDSDATYFRAIFNPYQHDKIYLIYGYGRDAIEAIKANIERICEIKVSTLCAHNEVWFLDVQKVDATRVITRDVVENYIRTL